MVSTRFFLRSAGIATFVFACSSPNPEPPSQVETVAQVQSSQPVAMPPDSLAVAPSPEQAPAEAQKPLAKTMGKSTIANRVETTPPVAEPRAPALAPHTTRVLSSVVSFEDQGKAYLVVLRIQRVIGRGTSCPPLTDGNEITVSVSKTTDQSVRLAMADAGVEVTLQHRLSPAIVKPTPPPWSVLTVH